MSHRSGRVGRAARRGEPRAWLLASVVSSLILPTAQAAEERVQREHVVVSYEGISRQYAEAIARTVSAARAIAAEQFGFDMPETITVTVAKDAAQRRLFNDGWDRVSLTVTSEKDLLQPSASGVYNLYGMCHEIGHLTMYRLIRDRAWLTNAAAEGWALYLGCRLVDGVYAREGEELWPDRYDYRNDGMKRLERGLSSANPGETLRAAELWKSLAENLGDKGIAPLFAAWDKSEIDAGDPAKAVGKALADVGRDERTAAWWTQAKDALLQVRERSKVAPAAIAEGRLSGKPAELAHDDGLAANKSSMAGGGHAVRFDSPGEGAYLTSVRIHGRRYGYPAPPKEDFHVWLCDETFKEIADFPFPYSKFERGTPKWVTLPVKPTRVPAKFIVCVGFNPTVTKGVFVSYDAEGSGQSLIGLPGGRSAPFNKGDWLIRVNIDQAAETAAKE